MTWHIICWKRKCHLDTVRNWICHRQDLTFRNYPNKKLYCWGCPKNQNKCNNHLFINIILFLFFLAPRITGSWIPRAPTKGLWWHLHVGSSISSFFLEMSRSWMERWRKQSWFTSGDNFPDKRSNLWGSWQTVTWALPIIAQVTVTQESIRQLPVSRWLAFPWCELSQSSVDKSCPILGTTQRLNFLFYL